MSARKASKTTRRPKKTAAKPRRAAAARPAPSSGKPLVAKQPQSKQQAAVKSGMFLYTDDAWSLRYFSEGDLHCADRELLG